MKKLLVMLMASAAVLACAAEEMDVNGAFKVSKPGAKLPDGWDWNHGPKPVGTYEVVQVDGKNAVKFVGEKSMLSLVFLKWIPAKPGEKYELSVNVTGTTGKGGAANVGMHLWDDRGYLQGDYAGSVKLTGGTAVIKRVITVPEKVTVKGKDGAAVDRIPTKIRVLFLLWSPGEAVFSNFTAKKLD